MKAAPLSVAVNETDIFSPSTQLVFLYFLYEDPDIAWKEKAVELELWSYNPLLFSRDGHVDVVSLYASLRNVTDERVEQAIEEVMRCNTWYTV